MLNDREFVLLLEACTALPDPRGFEARFVCLVGGRLDLRAGEIAHFQASWVDWDRKLIRIPQQEPCSCGYCRRQARQEVRHNDQLTAASAFASRWHPKTVASARSILFDLSLRIERFANRYDGFPRSRCQPAGPRSCRAGRPHRTNLSPLSAGDGSQPPCVQRCGPGPLTGTHGLEQLGDGPEIHPDIRDRHRRRTPTSTPQIAYLILY